MCYQTTESSQIQPGTTCQCGCHPPYQVSCQCGCGMHGILSKKKKIQALKDIESRLEDKLDDLKEYIKELETSK